MDSKEYCVYKHTLPKSFSKKENDMVYIGITCQKPEYRWGHGNGYKYNSYFSNSIEKYGWDNFIHEILFYGLSKSEAEQKEIELISYYQSNNKLYGYNIQAGGNLIADTISKPVVCIETKTVYESATDAQRQLGISNATISSCCRGVNKLAGGYHWMFEEEYNDKNAEDWIRKAKSKKYRTVYCVDTKTTYSSIVEASKDTGVNQNMISDCCKGKYKHAGGLRWMYLDDVSDEAINELMSETIEVKGKKQVVCIETGEVFENASQAAMHYGISASGVRMCCKKQTKTAAGFHWMYLKEYSIEEAKNRLYAISNNLHKKVICLNNNMVYNTISDAAKSVGSYVTAISACCKGKSKSAGKASDGTPLCWAYYQEAV